MELREHLLVIVLLIFVHLQNLDCTLSKNDPKKPRSKPAVIIKVRYLSLSKTNLLWDVSIIIAGNNCLFVLQEDPQEETVFERELVKVQTLAKEILSDYKAYSTKTNIRRVDKTVLGYITPVSALIFIFNKYLYDNHNNYCCNCSGMAMGMMWPKYLPTNLI